MGQQTSGELVAQFREAQTALVGLVFEQVLLTVADAHVHVQAVARAVAEGLGHERADQTHVGGDLGRTHLEEGEVITGGQRVGVGVVDLELAVRVLVVDLVDINAHCSHRLGEPLEKSARSRQALVVVAGLGQRVGGITRDDAALNPPQQRKLRLHAGVEGPALVGHARQLPLQNDA